MSFRTEKVGRTTFAFGLTWKEVKPDELKTTLEDLDDKAEQVHFITQGVNKRGPFGLGRKSASHGSSDLILGYHLGGLGGKVASYAATLASAAQDGFYICRVGDDLLWYCTIFNGRVGPGTDQIEPRVTVLERIRGLLNLNPWEIYADEHCLPLLAADGITVHPFDPVQAVAKAKPAWLIRRGTSKGEVFAASVLAVAAIAGFYWVYTIAFPKPPISTGPTPEEIRALYLSSLQVTMPVLSSDPKWAPDAFSQVRRELPAFRAGWTLQGVTCSPRDGCSGSYAPMSQGLWFSHEQFGAVAQAAPITSKAISTPTSLLTPSEDELLYSFPSYGRPVGEVAGTFGLRFAAARLQAAPSVESLSSNAGADLPQGAVPLIAERLIVGESSVPDDFLIRKVAAYFADEGFRPTQLAFSHGYGTQGSSWRIEFVRIRSEY